MEHAVQKHPSTQQPHSQKPILRGLAGRLCKKARHCRLQHPEGEWFHGGLSIGHRLIVSRISIDVGIIADKPPNRQQRQRCQQRSHPSCRPPAPLHLSRNASTHRLVCLIFRLHGCAHIRLVSVVIDSTSDRTLHLLLLPSERPAEEPSDMPSFLSIPDDGRQKSCEQRRQQQLQPEFACVKHPQQNLASRSLRKRTEQKHRKRRLSKPRKAIANPMLIQQLRQKEESSHTCQSSFDVDPTPQYRYSKDIDRHHLERSENKEAHRRRGQTYHFNTIDAMPQPHSRSQKTKLMQHFADTRNRKRYSHSHQSCDHKTQPSRDPHRHQRQHQPEEQDKQKPACLPICQIHQENIPPKRFSFELEASNQRFECNADDRKQYIWIENRLQLIDRKAPAASLCDAFRHKQAGDKEKRRHMKAVNKRMRERGPWTDAPSAMGHPLGGMAIHNQNDGDTLHNIDDVRTDSTRDWFRRVRCWFRFVHLPCQRRLNFFSAV